MRGFEPPYPPPTCVYDPAIMRYETFTLNYTMALKFPRCRTTYNIYVLKYSSYLYHDFFQRWKSC